MNENVTSAYFNNTSFLKIHPVKIYREIEFTGKSNQNYSFEYTLENLAGGLTKQE
jgi:hypothetical protein